MAHICTMIRILSHSDANNDDGGDDDIRKDYLHLIMAMGDVCEGTGICCYYYCYYYCYCYRSGVIVIVICLLDL